MAVARRDPYFAKSVATFDNFAHVIIKGLNDEDAEFVGARRNVADVMAEIDSGVLQRAGSWLTSGASKEFLSHVLVFSSARTRESQAYDNAKKLFANDPAYRNLREDILADSTPLYRRVVEKYDIGEAKGNRALALTLLALAYLYLVYVPSIRTPLNVKNENNVWKLRFPEAVQEHPFLSGLTRGFAILIRIDGSATAPAETRANNDDVTQGPISVNDNLRTDVKSAVRSKFNAHQSVDKQNEPASAWLDSVDSKYLADPLLFLHALPTALALQWAVALTIFLEKGHIEWKEDGEIGSTDAEETFSSIVAKLSGNVWLWNAAMLFNDDAAAIAVASRREGERAGGEPIDRSEIESLANTIEVQKASISKQNVTLKKNKETVKKLRQRLNAAKKVSA